MNGYGVRGGGNPALSNGGLNGGLNGGINGGISDSLDNGLNSGMTVTEDDNAIAAYYDHEADDAGVTSPLLGNGTAIAMAAAGNGNVTGAALEPEMMMMQSSTEAAIAACHTGEKNYPQLRRSASQNNVIKAQGGNSIGLFFIPESVPKIFLSEARHV